MSGRERVHRLVDELSADDLGTVERMLRGLRLPPAPGANAPGERRRRVYQFAGSLAHLPGSVDEFLARKHADKAREDERERRRQAGV